ncbi:GNAT family N-acetyltransferase [Plebeiibacterium marinum]|uniref:GNAT family N-acetyltransferase n=1 Tax=Plebeiibacterium marinum TaxID=2992111 RepID=A0AAE3SL61_9BACT|nr:GNAT family N-acetyltransferase [Plebeiobacterium marinum]MCW3807099.1 GNAT family N-acetyltransferase [Plebeiobacterium marinum]
MAVHLHLVSPSDLIEIRDIYNYYIINSTATFHTEEIGIDDVKNIIPLSHPKYKSYLIKNNNEVCGYAYLGCYKPRQAYDRTAEVTIYLKPGMGGKGIGKTVLKQIEPLAKEKDIKVLLGIITGENTASIRLFEKCGYEKCAHFRQVGEKFGRILDVVAYEKILD